jgi:hypothetical protein
LVRELLENHEPEPLDDDVARRLSEIVEWSEHNLP